MAKFSIGTLSSSSDLVANQSAGGESTYTILNDGMYRVVCVGTESSFSINNIDIVYNATNVARQTVIIPLMKGTVCKLKAISSGAGVALYSLINA